jgi:hypothetical protein
LWLWEEFNPEHSYLLVADVARGDGKDYSAFHVIDITEMKQVAEYQGKVEIDMYATFLADIGRQYGDAMLVVENNNVGYAVLTKLEDLGYSNLYYSTKGTHQYLDSYAAKTSSNSILGFTTSMKTRPLIIAKLEEFVRNDLITVRSSRLLNELRTFVWNNGKPEAMKGYNDDLVMSLAIACWVRDTALVSNQRDIEYRKAFLNSMTSSKTTLNTKIAGMIGYSGTKYENQAEETQELMRHFPGLFKG